jgi:hypothetical protein
MFENRVLRRIFVPKRDEVTGEWRELHSEELHNLYSSTNITIIRYVKSRQVRWAGHMARMGEEKKVYNVLVGKAEGKRSTGNQSLGWRMESELNLRRLDWGAWIGFE